MHISYEIIWANGKTESGVGQAESFVVFKQQWRAKGAIVLKMDEVQPQATLSLFLEARITTAQRCTFTRQMAGLVDAGLGIDKALLSMLKQTGGTKEARTMSGIIQSLYDQVREGKSLSRAMEFHPRNFDSSYRSVIAAAEQSGAMGSVLEQLANELETGQSLRSTLLAACLYPGVVSLFAIVMVLFLMTYVVPQVANVFVSSNRALPILTTVMLGASAFILQWWWLGSAVLFGLFLMVVQLNRYPQSGRKMDAALLRLPLLGELLQTYNTAKFSSTLALLTKSGVPILRALEISVQTMGNRAMKAPLLNSLTRIREGAGISRSLEETQVFPDVLITFSSLGEQTGRLPEMLERVSRQLSTDVTRRATGLAGIVEPLLIVTMGLVVMLIVLSVLLPIIDLNTMIR